MRPVQSLFAGVLAISLLALPARAADHYQVDPVHSMIIFRISHLGISHIYGRFNAPTGSLMLDESNPAQSTFEFTVPAANVDTAVQKRDDDLRSAHFFDVKKFPDITFKSTGVKSVGDNKFEVIGVLSLHGVTKTILVPVTKLGEADTPMGHRTGWEAQFDLKRSDYGMTYLQGPVGDEVHLIVAFEARKEPAKS